MNQAPAPTQSSTLATGARSLGILLILTVLTGVVYPLVVTAIGKGLFPARAAGSLVSAGGTSRGSRLIGQPFEEPKYFWSRLSATSPSYNPSSSAGSNLGPTNADLTKKAKERIDALRAADPGNEAPVPVDLVTSSASGLDPHISPAAAAYQAKRVARVRGVSEERVQAAIANATEGRFLGLIGEPTVNVLELNLALDALP